jgi:EAL domain-containing protein (putative c-di-GMP-specific phosphodiesterase class I)
MLRAVCRQIVAWKTTHPDLEPWVAVNLAAAQFETEDLLFAVASTLDETGVDPSRLHLELTESGLTVDTPRTREMLAQLKGLGVVLALDDFGTGWSSLKYIQSYPMDVVKIDRSFIRSIDEDGGEQLAATIVFMAQQLGLHVVAEGVETRTQYRVLRELGVQDAQGYHFSRPLSADRAVRFLRPVLREEPSRPWDLLEVLEGGVG